MKKRRNLVRKIGFLSMCVLLMVSAFFYVPMDVKASEVAGSDTVQYVYGDWKTVTFPVVYDGVLNLANWISYSDVRNVLYCRVVRSSVDLSQYIPFVDGQAYDFELVSHAWGTPTLESDFTYGTLYNYYSTGGEQYILPGDGLPIIFDGSPMYYYGNYQQCWTYRPTLDSSKGTYYIGVGESHVIYNATCTIQYRTVDIVGSEDDLSSYEQGYNAGYSEGLAQGESSGYSSGYSDGYEAGESSGYESGFQEGADSVDTQSYYDAGYSSGYSAGYSAGYDTGYDSGYADAMSRVESWGADTTEYPVLIFEGHHNSGVTDIEIYIGDDYILSDDTYPTAWSSYYYGSVALYDLSEYDFNPNHTYQIKFTNFYNRMVGSGSMIFSLGSSDFTVGKHSSANKSDLEFYISGSDIGNLLTVSCDGVCYYNNSVYDCSIYFDKFYLYDMGPSGDTQNHIANQTDQLTNGFDSSSGQESASQFADGVAEYETAENSIFTSAQSGLADYEFFDFQSVPAVVTGLSFVTSIMTSIFNSMGGASGAGIVLSVLFSVMLVSIVIGTYRYFQSSGKVSRGSRKKG